ncbi:protein of unknown function [uncultured Woeseiaceae bacterium]|uniref:Carbamoyltransferase domain-containing protein n=1 Tax=uncultured Woeseiaceae bacterium TaxID=1983305 RepID=A0A7D9H6A8_9GAMM|nr:protein of unknown function [uncultured Woeseiaceae bacterium]
MTKSILGISAYYHDAAAALLRDDEIVAAAQVKRFTRKKHDARFPRHAIDYCLEDIAKLTDLDPDTESIFDSKLPLHFSKTQRNAI